jgi:hypothetical protein
MMISHTCDGFMAELYPSAESFYVSFRQQHLSRRVLSCALAQVLLVLRSWFGQDLAV